ncbi:hypothetical protein GQ600_4528 [Phytophthora cactorum]|nr:hypothetical protein GQ600_4528 [Phytophthora cactorum]
MDAATEVIVLDDSSDASSEGEMTRASARAQSVGYADAVEAALAMAASLETKEPSASRNTTKKKEKKGPQRPAVAYKGQETTAVKNREKTVHRRSGRERQRSVQSSRSRKRSNSLSSSSDSDSSSSSSSESRRRPRFVVAGGGDRPSTASSGKSGLSARRRSSASASGRHQVEGRRRASAGAQPRVKSKQPAEVVDLLSSSSSSESSVRCRSRSSSVSSLMSSDNESVTRTPVKTAKKRLVLNERVSKPRPDTISGSKSAETVGSLCPKQSTSNPMPAGKRKRVLPQMRREISGGVKKRGRDPGDQLTKQKSGKKKPVGSGARSQDSVSKLSTATQNAPVSLLSSLSSDSSDSSSPPSSPRPVPARKSVTTPSTAPQSTGQAREGETDAFGRYHCRKSVPGGANSPSGKAKSVSPSSASAVSANSLSSPSPSPSPRKKRRVLTYFDTDHVALDDLQAQERELAWIRSQRKQTQTQNQSRSTKTAAQKRKTSQEVIYMDDHSDASSAVNSEERAHGDGQPKQSKTKVKLSATADRTPLDSYETDTLASHCSILESFGKPTQCISSVFPSEVAKPQSDVTRAVSSLVMAHLLIIRRCHRKKVQAMLSEARKKIAAYQAALKKHKQTPRGQNVMTSHLLPRSTAEKYVVRQLKAVQHTCSQKRTVSSLIQINCIEETRPLRKYTTSIGLRANYRVEDDPILRYTVSTRPSETDGGDELAKKYGLQIGSVADEEVAEFMLRLVVGRLGDSEQVFHALKSELGFSQAYTAYCELKKLHDSRQRARTRLDRIEKLRGDGEHSSDPDVAAIVKLLEQRLQPPICNLESSIVDSLVDGATAGMAALGCLVDVYYGSFCRMCYRYACHEHGGDHPLPARRVDPVYPRAQLTAASCDRSGAASSDEDVICLGSEVTGEARHFDTAARVRREAAVPSVSKVQQVGVESDMDMSDGGSGPQQRRRQRKTMADPSEYLDASHVSLVAEKMHSFLSVGSACGKLCWKNDGRIHVSAQRTTLSAAELGVIRKLRETMGDNSCLLSPSSARPIKEQANVERGGVADGVGRSGRRVRNWKRGRRSGGSNHELLQRTRNQRLQDRGTENHEYQPCMHEGMCDSTGCSCMKRDHMCEKACACSRDCPNSVCGVHHITIWALRNIAVGEELVFDYGYKRSVGPDWSQRRAASKDSKDSS